MGGNIKMGLFDKKTDEEKRIESEALKELDTYKEDTFFKFRQLLPLYGISNMGFSETRFFNTCFKKIKKEIKNNSLKSNEIKGRFTELLNEKYGEPMNQYEANKKLQEEKLKPLKENEKKLEEKFNIKFQNRVWFKCAIEERKNSTFTNTSRREVDNAYVFIENNYLEILKESVFLKSNMGTRKIYFENVAGIDYDARGKLHLSSSLIINLKSADFIQLKNVPENMVNAIDSRYNSFLHHKNNATQNTVVIEKTSSESDKVDPMKKIKEAKELLDVGAITEEEFDKIKAKYLKDF
ncbi:hypothetical protein sm9_1234 [Methanobrevibacter millerae]|uniref:Short C-terminal domain-containing protein n=2 Tax=Methanobrevibacter millerae TaxID=230361 RepID=A0A0U3E4R8_9EURY|nr:hypothetical protein sm9_1234 [Methanobrevibacter millerae]